MGIDRTEDQRSLVGGALVALSIVVGIGMFGGAVVLDRYTARLDELAAKLEAMESSQAELAARQDILGENHRALSQRQEEAVAMFQGAELRRGFQILDRELRGVQISLLPTMETEATSFAELAGLIGPKADEPDEPEPSGE